MKINTLQCLVTGGAGFIGSHLVDKLMDSGCRVRVIDNLVNGKLENIAHHLDNENFDFFKGSITDPFDVERVMKGIEVVFHLACLGVRHSLTHPFENHRVNTEGTLFLLETARKMGVKRFIHCSSSEVYGTASQVPMTESHPTLPCTIYGASKLAAEAYARAYFKTYGFPACIIRPFNTFGPRSHHEGDAGEMIPKSIVRLLSRKKITIFGDGSQTRDFTYVEDTAKGLIAAAECEGIIGKTMNIGSNFEISIRDLAVKLTALVHGDVTIDKAIEFTDDRPGDVLRLYADASAFIETTSWNPEVKFEEGLLKTIQFFKNHPAGISALIRDEIRCNWSLEK